MEKGDEERPGDAARAGVGRPDDERAGGLEFFACLRSRKTFFAFSANRILLAALGAGLL